MRPEKIAEEFKKRFDCSQVVLVNFADKLGISREEAYKMSACFGGGMGVPGGTCGAIAGAMIAIGIKYGQYDPEHMEQKDIMAAKRSQFFEKIRDKYPSVLCKDVLGYDLTNAKERALIVEKGLIYSVCPVAVADVIAALEEVL